jgi:arabinose-5-phosphate isomerase
MEKYDSFEHLKVVDVMTLNPKSIDFNEMAVDALSMMKANNITQLLVLKDNIYSGVVHLHDLLKEGII